MTETAPTPAANHLAAGERLGPYEIVAPLGAGGMGEVYRARDTRLHREVALKVVHPALAGPRYIERLGREARAAAALNHPNILAVFDVNIDGPVPYIVSELLEGESLRSRLVRGAVPWRKALEFGIQLAQALAAAHAKGILHRDIKPGNVFLVADGQVKLLDFGLAKRESYGLPADSESPTASGPTWASTSDQSRPGHVIGTAGYMAPEQALGEPIDHRPDIFSLGAVLYEMLGGRHPFRRPTPVETMRAVLSGDPEDLLAVNPALPPALVAAVGRCLEKNRDERFQSARDLAFHLRQLTHASSDTHPLLRRPRSVRRVGWLGLGVALALAAGVALEPLLQPPAPPPTFQQLTFRRGRIGGARFADEAIVYSRAVGWEEQDVWLRLAGWDVARPLGYPGAVLATRGGEVALLTGSHFRGGKRFVGTLAVAPLGGGAPSEILGGVADADWDRESGEFVVARSEGLGSGSELEYPIGRVLYRSPGAILSPRISRDGRHLAFLEDEAGVGTGGRVIVLDRDGSVLLRDRFWAKARGLAWSPGGDEVWLAAGEGSANRALRALRMDGTERLVHESPGSLTVLDVAADGRVLISREDERMAMVGMPPGAAAELELSWFDDAGVASLSRDGRMLLFGDRFGIYLRPTDGTPAVRLEGAEGWADELSPDGSLVLTTSRPADRVILVPTGPGEPRPLDIEGGIEALNGLTWLPDGRRIVVNGREPDRELRSFIVGVEGGRPRPVTDEGDWVLSVSPDGDRLASTSKDHGMRIWPTAGGAATEVPGSIAEERPVAWSADGSFLWVFRRGRVPADVLQVDVATGRRRVWKTLSPPDATGVYSIEAFRVTPSGHAYFYSYRQTLSELYEARGFR